MLAVHKHFAAILKCIQLNFFFYPEAWGIYWIKSIIVVFRVLVPALVPWKLSCYIAIIIVLRMKGVRGKTFYFQLLSLPNLISTLYSLADFCGTIFSPILWFSIEGLFKKDPAVRGQVACFSWQSNGASPIGARSLYPPVTKWAHALQNREKGVYHPPP